MTAELSDDVVAHQRCEEMVVETDLGRPFCLQSNGLRNLKEQYIHAMKNKLNPWVPIRRQC